MARIRSIKPQVRRSRTVTSWPREVRLAWIYLWGYLDDHGYGEDDLQLIKAECFPRDRDVTEKKLDVWLDMMATTRAFDEDEPSLCRYEIDGIRFLHAPKWHDHQKINRPQKSVIPRCPITHKTGSAA